MKRSVDLAEFRRQLRSMFKLVMAAAKTWRRLKGENQLPKVVQGVTFRNSVEVTNTPAQNVA
jgi:putative transposase